MLSNISIGEPDDVVANEFEEGTRDLRRYMWEENRSFTIERRRGIDSGCIWRRDQIWASSELGSTL